MSLFLVNILLSIVWVALRGEYTVANLVVGFVLGYLLIWLGRPFFVNAEYFRSKDLEDVGERVLNAPEWLFRWSRFTLVFLWEVMLANIQVAVGVLSPISRLRPGVLAVPLDVTTDAQITLLANMITLTPGTLSLDLSNDRQVLYVYFFHIVDPERSRREVKEGFERMVQEVMPT